MRTRLRVTVLVDNDHTREGDPPKKRESPFAHEWGLSLWFDYIDDAGERHAFMMDTGSEGGFALNAKLLGIRVEDAELLVLSHAHYDHTDGTDLFLSLNHTASVFISHNAGEDCVSQSRDGKIHYIGVRRGLFEEYPDRFVFTQGITELFPGAYLVPHAKKDYTKISARQHLFRQTPQGLVPDTFRHEQSLVLRTDSGIHIFSPCSHTGMANITEEVAAAFPGEALRSFTGGLHLFRLHEDETRQEAVKIRDLAFEKIAVGHCTGEKQTDILKEYLGDRLCPFESGASWEL